MTDNILIRYSEPNKYDQAPCGTLCKLISAMSDEFSVYIQISKDDTNPVWSFIGVFTPDNQHLIQDGIKKILSLK